MRAVRLFTTVSLLGLGVASLPVSAGAQDLVSGEAAEAPADGGEIVVTAQRREERSVDVPITVTTLGRETLETANVQQITDISRITPALRFDFSSSFVQPSIRGVGNSVVTAGSAGNVGIYVDGFYTPNPLGSAFQLMNVNSIQVLKGPQGTLFGRNTTGGAILVQTAEPSTQTGGRAKVSYGRFNEVRAQAYATVGLSDNVAFDAEGLYSRGDGWQRNISNGRRVGDYENWSARFGLKVDVSDDISVLLRFQHDESDDPRPLLTSGYRDPIFGSGAPFFASPGEVTFSPDEVALGADPLDQEFFRSRANIVQATIRADLGFANLTSYTQYRKEDVDTSIDSDYNGTVTLSLGIPNDNETFSQELLLTSKAGSRLQYTVGLFYFQNRDTYNVFFDYLPAAGVFGRSDVTRFGSNATTRSYAAFADFTYEVTPKLFVTVGGRFAHDQIDDAYYYNLPSFLQTAAPPYPFRNYVQDVNPAAYQAARQNHFTPRFVVRYKPTEDTSIYASFTKGYKAALLDVGGGSGNYIRPEDIKAYEIGAKYSSGRLSAEAAAFHYDYKDLQVSLYRSGQAQLLNAATSKIYGVEAQVRFDVTDNFQVSAGGSWVHARYKRFDDAPVYVPCLSTVSALAPAGLDNCATLGVSFPIQPTLLTDSTMQRTPEFTGNIAMRYTTALAGGKLALSGNLYYSSKFFFGPSGTQWPQKAFETVSVRTEWTDPSDRFTVALWGDNVTNSRYYTSVQYNTGGVGANWSKPVTYGIELGARF